MKTKSTATPTATTPKPAPAPICRRIYTQSPRPVIDMGQRTANRALAAGPLLDMMHTLTPELHKAALIVGSWVWVSLDTPPPQSVRATLAQFGFHWNNKRQVWQHPCGNQDTTAGPGDPRQRYGCQPATNYVPA